MSLSITITSCLFDSALCINIEKISIPNLDMYALICTICCVLINLDLLAETISDPNLINHVYDESIKCIDNIDTSPGVTSDFNSDPPERNIPPNYSDCRDDLMYLLIYLKRILLELNSFLSLLAVLRTQFWSSTHVEFWNVIRDLDILYFMPYTYQAVQGNSTLYYFDPDSHYQLINLFYYFRNINSWQSANIVWYYLDNIIWNIVDAGERFFPDMWESEDILRTARMVSENTYHLAVALFGLENLGLYVFAYDLLEYEFFEYAGTGRLYINLGTLYIWFYFYELFWFFYLSH